MSLTVTDLRVHYRTLRGDVQALDGVTFDIPDGEILGLAGESGCGKTTLGKSLIRLDGRMRHVGGTALLNGTELPISDDRAMNAFRFHQVSLVPQYSMSALNPTRRIGRMIRELLASRGVPADTAELHRRLGLVGLAPEVLDRYPIELSGGMKQRVVMVISTLLDPALLIADEITSALDVSTQQAVARALVGLRDRGLVDSMMFITHDLALTSHIADSIMVMYAGRLAEKAPSKVLTTEPRHPYTKLLLGSLPEVGVRHAERRLTGIEGSPPSLLRPPARHPTTAPDGGPAVPALTGCRFRDRCPLADAGCAEQPPSVEIAPRHHVACWKA
ncbi:ABC transporter ATP-binding protein [Streptomyces sp. TS71-3]|uniref:ABC transporter ATP-binding protein n=1 Tax=Streptomyces sp. TS71-3 TaxID=2733862 RepID=UPI001B01253E|nr:ABC transporter ATP-binding protein [Streptomyces sp. TS71-3]GHJ37288.1 dipeptide/oligopeptide/nickel ABC transporter ATP-binding protein [Streptomyces sp. TS71-3]